MITFRELTERNAHTLNYAWLAPKALKAALAATALIHRPAHWSLYQHVSEQTGIPAFLIGAIHVREAAGMLSRRLQDGEAQPSDVGWTTSAIQILRRIKPHDTPITTTPQALAFAELWNGLGYAERSIPSPYVWAMTTAQRPGKYTSDGHFDPNHWDSQPGVAAMYLAEGNSSAQTQSAKGTPDKTKAQKEKAKQMTTPENINALAVLETALRNAAQWEPILEDLIPSPYREIATVAFRLANDIAAELQGPQNPARITEIAATHSERLGAIANTQS